MEEISYALMDPTGNITMLVDTPVPPDRQPAAAARLMALAPETEQVGFITYGEGPSVSLRMAGGEFCGNAAMSAAALCAERAWIQHGRIIVRVEGTPAPTAVDIQKLPDGWRGTVAMPRPLSVREERFPDGAAYPVVRFDGISHVILEAEPDRPAMEALAPEWCRFLGADALGLMFLDAAAGQMTPLVYVPGAGTLCWESSCASGTSAAGAFLAARSGGACTAALRQPGGVLEISADPDGTLLLTGTVRLRRRGAAPLTP